MKRHGTATNRAACALALLCLGAAAVPAPAQTADPTQGDIVIFPAPEEITYSPRQAKPKPRVSGAKTDGAGEASVPVVRVSGVHITGNNFRAGTGWWVLLCKSAGKCRLAPARMSVAPATHDVYDGEPVPSQVMSWTLIDTVQAADETMLVQFKPIRSLAALPLKAGEVPTLLNSEMSEYPDTHSLGRAGTLEVKVPTPGVTTLLVPRLVRSENEGKRVEPGSPAGENDAMVLELQAGSRREIVGSFDQPGIEGIRPIPPKTYLIWAGDLDGDGKPDYILDLSGGGSRHLSILLSSQAKQGGLVGEAGSFNFYDPSFAGC